MKFFLQSVLKKEFDNLDYDKIFSLPLDDNGYVNDVNSCTIILMVLMIVFYCGSCIVVFRKYHRNNQSLFTGIRSHRIFPKNIWSVR